MSHVCFVGKEWKNTNDRPWVDRGLFYQVRVEARPCYNKITSTQISLVEDVKARHVRCCFTATVKKHLGLRETTTLGRRVSDALFCVVAKVTASAMIVRSCYLLIKYDYIYTTVLSMIRRMRRSCGCVKYIIELCCCC